MNTTASPADTARALPYGALADSIAALLRAGAAQVPPRIVMPMGPGGSLFVMPATDGTLAITKLISFVADNPAHGRPAIQGDVVVFDARSGQRLAVLDGPTVTARRTAAVSLLAARLLLDSPARTAPGPLLIVGAGVQGRAHLEAFAEGLGVRQVWVASRSASSAQALAAHARTLGLQAQVSADPDAALAHCPLVVSATPAQQVCLRQRPRDDALVCAVGAFTPRMVEWHADVVRHIAQHGRIVVDTRDADHEAGDLLQAGIDVSRCASLADIVGAAPPAQTHSPGLSAETPPRSGPIFFKSCGWAGWDLAAARCVVG